MGKCRLLAVFNGYQLRELNVFLSYIRALKVAGNYRPGRRKMGFNLRFEGAMPSGIYRCLQSVVHSKQALPLSLQRRLACFCVYHS